MKIWMLLVWFALAWSGLVTAETRFPRGEPLLIEAAPATAVERGALERLQSYATAVTGVPARVVPRARGRAIVWQRRAAGPSPESYAISARAGRVTLAAANGRALRYAVQRLITLSEQTAGGLVIPDVEVTSAPWIPEREWALCPWAPQHVRGAFFNPWADARMDVFRFSTDQLQRYVAMFDAFGYSGVQLLETSYSYGVFGSPEAFQDRQRVLARAARALGANVSLWVWAAEFSSYGWTDAEVVYQPQKGKTAFDDPAVRRGFEKYYDLYARLAPDVDRLIGHFYDPGQLSDRQDVFRYMRLLEQKFKAANPRIKLAIDAWGTGHEYISDLLANGFRDYLVLEMSMPNLYKPGQRERIHEEARKLGVQLGVWGWYTTEYETDQLASMYVNARVLRNFYRQMRDGALRIHPVSYWSEMEAHHLNNLASMYAAGQLLWDPDRDPDALLRELAEGIWGPLAGRKVFEAWRLIEEVRSGDDWETYWWRQPGYRLGTASPETDLDRAQRSIKELEGLRPDPGFVAKFPLPCSPETLVELMLPHLRQIEAYARFRIGFAALANEASALGRDALTRRLADLWRPVPEYGTWVGTFGLPENREIDRQLREFARQHSLATAEPAWQAAQDVDRLWQWIRSRQARIRQEFRFRLRDANEFFWEPDRLQARLEALRSKGVIEEVAPGSYRLADWEFFRALP
jgi:hypothetical protein